MDQVFMLDGWEVLRSYHDNSLFPDTSSELCRVVLAPNPSDVESDLQGGEGKRDYYIWANLSFIQNKSLQIICGLKNLVFILIWNWS
jgi:hypothetical protein